MAKLRCYDCRQKIEDDEVCVMVVNVGSSARSYSGGADSTAYTAGLFSGSSSSAHYGKVDLCPGCAKAREDQAASDLQVRQFLFFLILIPVAAGFLFGSFETGALWFFGTFVFLSSAVLVSRFYGKLRSRSAELVSHEPADDGTQDEDG
jgi:hypothetical protein